MKPGGTVRIGEVNLDTIIKMGRELTPTDFLLECDGEPIAELLREELGLPQVKCWKRKSKEYVSFLHVGNEGYRIDPSAFDGIKVRGGKKGTYGHSCTLPELLAEYGEHPEIVARIRELTLPVEVEAKGDWLIVYRGAATVIDRLLGVSREEAVRCTYGSSRENPGDIIELFPLGARIKAYRTRMVTEEVTE